MVVILESRQPVDRVSGCSAFVGDCLVPEVAVALGDRGGRLEVGDRFSACGHLLDRRQVRGCR
jgi:hypothetical protein